MNIEKLFYIDDLDNKKISYKRFFSDLSGISEISVLCKKNSIYEYFLYISASLISQTPIVLLDSDLSESEIKELCGNGGFLQKNNVTIPEIKSFEEFLSLVKAGASSWTCTLFTSGTTGTPKRISHSLKSLARQAKISPKHSDDVWGFAYNPTHIAGLQVFFQALFNANTIVRLFGIPAKALIETIQKEAITHISATPTFFRMLPAPDRPIQSVRAITSGGEKFDARAMEKLSKAFPSARIHNIYASTEMGSVLASKGDIFTPDENTKKLLQIKDGELWIHKSLAGKSENIALSGEWYNTGDCVEIISENPLSFKFLSRKNEIINVGGYNVNPNEVEQALMEIDGIRAARVFAKKNSILGNIICAEIVSESGELDETSIRKRLSNRLQAFKIPRIIKFVETLKSTNTGKLSRKP